MPSWFPWLFIAALLAAGLYGVSTALVTTDPAAPIPPPTNATPVWFSGDLADGEIWATIAARVSPVPTAVPVPMPKTRTGYVANPCHDRLRGPICPTELPPQAWAGH